MPKVVGFWVAHPFSRKAIDPGETLVNDSAIPVS